MAKKSKGAFADAGAAVSKAFHDLERAVMGMMATQPKAKQSTKAKKAKKTKAKKKAKR